MAGLGKVYSIEEIKEKVLPILENKGVTRAYIFGSYAKGCPSPRSDLDLLVKSNLHGFAFGGLLADLFDVFGYGTVDVYDEREIIPGTEFERELIETRIRIL